MKKLALILAAILVVMSFPMMLMSNVSAAGATVTYTKGGAAKTTTTIADAINNADNNTTIYLTGGDYVLTARENWKIWNKTLSLDLGGNTIKSSGTADGQFQGSGRVINVGFDGATHGPGADKAGAITLLNGRFENAAGSPMFQLYSNMSLTFGEGCVVDLHSASLFGICVMQANSKVTFGNGSVVRNTLATPFASEEEAKTTSTDNSWYTGVGLNEGGCTLTFEEGCYVETSGATFKTGKDKGNIVVNGGTIITHYKAIFVTGNADFSLTIKGGNFYNAIYCPTDGNPTTTGSLGKCNIITWIGSNGTLNISGSPKFYSLYEQTRQIAAYVYFPRFVQHLHAGLFAVLYRFEFPCESLRDVDGNRHALGGFAAGRCEAEGRSVSAFKGYFAVRLLAVDRYYGLFKRVVILVSRAEYLYAFPVGGLQCAAGHHFVFPNVTK